MNCVYCGECDLVDDLTISHEGASQTHQSVAEMWRNTGIRRSSLGRIRATHSPTGKQRAYAVANAFSGSVVRWEIIHAYWQHQNIVWRKLRKSVQDALSYRTKPSRHFFMTHDSMVLILRAKLVLLPSTCSTYTPKMHTQLLQTLLIYACEKTYMRT